MADPDNHYSKAPTHTTLSTSVPIASLIPNSEATIQFFTTLPGLTAAYLFGSRARGDAGPISDYDIALLFAKNTPATIHYDSLLYAGGKLTSLFRCNDVDVISLNDTTSLALKFEAIERGIPLFSRDDTLTEDSVTDFEIRCRHEYFDHIATKRRLGLSDKGRAVNEKIQKKTENLSRYLSLLERYKSRGFSEVLADPDLIEACERCLYLAMQSAINLAEIVVKQEKLGSLDSMSEAFEKLGQVGILSQDLTASLVKIVGFRNALSHGYEKINYKVMEQVLFINLSDLAAFCRLVVDRYN